MIDYFKKNVDFLSRITILLIIVAGMSVINPPAFLNWNNLSTVMFQQAPFTILMSFGMTRQLSQKGSTSPWRQS